MENLTHCRGRIVDYKVDAAFVLLTVHMSGKKDRVGRYYNDSDVRFALGNVDHELVTLDYKAWELTEFQYPMDLYMYVQDVERAASHLKGSAFREGKKGRVVLLPM
ncbi:MAG: hypothetical protein ACRD4B_03120, partial [Acidobacteriota bacterium]